MRVLLIIFFSLNFSIKVFSQENWKTFTDTIDTYTLKFKYPTKSITRWAEGGICVDKTDSSDYPTEWCIWMTEPINGEGIEESVKAANELASKQVSLSEKRDSIIISGQKALRVVLMNNKTNIPFVVLIFLEKYGTLFEIENWRPDLEKFQAFLKTIQIRKIIKRGELK